MSARVALVRCAGYEESAAAVARAVELLGGWGLSAGQQVLVKPNVVMGAAPERAVATHPQVLAAAVRGIAAQGARPVVTESPGGPFSGAWVNRSFRTSGYDVVLEAGAVYNDDYESTSREVVGGKMMRRATLCRAIDTADAIVNVCKLKMHGLTVFTGATKNLFGLVPGLNKMQFHARYPEIADFCAAINDVALCVGDALHIMDGVVGMEGEGPSHGTARQVGVVLASRSPWALDHVASGLVGLDAIQVPMLADARARGLYDPAAVELLGDDIPSPICRFALPASRKSALGNFNNGPLGAIARKFSDAKPSVQKKRCVGCALCKNSCPPHAIEMKNNRPAFDYKKCIRCYCCQELCPHGAIQVKKSLLGRL